MAFRPSLKKKRQFVEAEANITPVMNLMCVLIPMLLTTAKFVDLALLEYMPPVIQETEETESGGPGQGGGSTELLELRVNIAYDALEISILNAVEGDNYTHLPVLPNGAYDFQAFQEKLVDIKERIVGPALSQSEEINPDTGQLEIVHIFKYEDADQIRVSAEGDIPLQVVIKLLDTAREYQDSRSVFQPLFPSPALGQFQ
ncbi:biopolymer transporter ExbD [bacterium]|nr:biopolymer transporter ExbD [bacterium]